MVQGIAQAVLDLALMLGVLHVDEIDHDQAAEVAQTHLAGDFIGRFEVGVVRGLFDIAALGGACRVDVDRYQRLGVVDDDGAAGGQVDRARKGRLDLVFDLEAREQRNVVAVMLDLVDVGRHDVRHELLRLLVDILGVDEDLADVGREIVADGTDHQAAFLVDQEGARHRLRGAVDGFPQAQQVVEVPLEFLGVASDAGGARDQAHAVRDVELGERVAQFVALLALDAARHAAAARVGRHQHDIAAGQRDVGGERRALVAALVLLHLDQELLAFLQVLGDAAAVGQTGAGDFLERQETVAFAAVVDERGLQAGFDAGDDTLVDVALALFLAGGLDVKVDQLLAVDDGNPEFFRLGCVEKHALHLFLPRACIRDRPDCRWISGSCDHE